MDNCGYNRRPPTDKDLRVIQLQQMPTWTKRDQEEYAELTRNPARARMLRHVKKRYLSKGKLPPDWGATFY